MLFVIAVLFSSFLIYFLFKDVTSKRRPYPPGPTPLPLIGNILDMPKSRDHETYGEWSRRYGDVVHVTAFGRHIVILSSIEAANDLLETRSAKYSSRPYIPMLHEPGLMNAGWALPVKFYDNHWKRHRRLFVNQMNSSTMNQYHDRLLVASYGLLRSLLRVKAVEAVDDNLRHTIAEVIMGIAYGYDVQERDDPFIKIAARSAKEVGDGSNPAKYLVNVIPLLKHLPEWLPGGGYKKFAAQGRKTGQDLVRIPFEDLMTKIASGTASPSFASNALADVAESEGNANVSDSQRIRDIQEVAAAIYGAGMDTLASSALALLLALILFPDAQVRAQAEIDSVLGSPNSSLFRLPTFKDRPKLPYTNAILMELMRWWQPLPIGFPHTSTEDDEYRGWHIPKGSIIFANAWVIFHDEKLFPDPWVFRPERFLDRKDPIRLNPALCGFFGFGRRICPGRPLAEDLLWITIATILASFKVVPAKDKEGNEINVQYAMLPREDFVIYPQTFPCSFIARSEYAEARIRETSQG